MENNDDKMYFEFLDHKNNNISLSNNINLSNFTGTNAETTLKKFMSQNNEVDDESDNETKQKKRKKMQIPSNLSSLISNFQSLPISQEFLNTQKLKRKTVKIETHDEIKFIDSKNPVEEKGLPLNSNHETHTECMVARFGRIYKRKMPSRFGYNYVQKVEGYRYCRFCNANLPLSAFYVTTKRYVCRRHHYIRVRHRFLERVNNNELVECTWNSWCALNNNKIFIGYDKIRYDQGDIHNIFKNLGNIAKIKSLKPVCIPIDFTIPMRPRNVAVLSFKAFDFLIKLITFIPHRVIYIAFVQYMNLLPPNFDVGTPDTPYKDPNYIRKDIDLGSMFSEFQKLLPIVREHEDNTIIEEFEKDGNVPWLTSELLPAGEAGKWLDGKPICEDYTKKET